MELNPVLFVFLLLFAVWGILATLALGIAEIRIKHQSKKIVLATELLPELYKKPSPDDYNKEAPE